MIYVFLSTEYFQAARWEADLCYPRNKAPVWALVWKVSTEQARVISRAKHGIWHDTRSEITHSHPGSSNGIFFNQRSRGVWIRCEDRHLKTNCWEGCEICQLIAIIWRMAVSLPRKRLAGTNAFIFIESIRPWIGCCSKWIKFKIIL